MGNFFVFFMWFYYIFMDFYGGVFQRDLNNRQEQEGRQNNGGEMECEELLSKRKRLRQEGGSRGLERCELLGCDIVYILFGL